MAEETIPHYPDKCASCNQKLTGENQKPYLGYYVLELKPQKSGFKVVCQLHHYYEARCECGHFSKARPGEGYISCVEGRSVDLKLTEYVLVGPMLATFIASLSVRYRMSRAKIQEFLHDWVNTELSRRQRCLAHLIRKAIALSGAINQKAAKIGKFILTELKELISAIAQGFEKSSITVSLHLSLLRGNCLIGSLDSHEKLKALANEILNDWDAVIAFVNHPELPPTNNEAERALRHAVIGRRISYGTRTSEGSLAYSSLLSVIETCRLRNINPWIYICEVITLGRKGLPPPPVPTG